MVRVRGSRSSPLRLDLGVSIPPIRGEHSVPVGAWAPEPYSALPVITRLCTAVGAEYEWRVA